MSDTSLNSLYTEVIMDHARARYGGQLADGAAGESHQINPTCGDEITLRVHLGESGEQVDALSWDGHGCAISQASASVLASLAAEESLTEVRQQIDAFRAMLRSRGSDQGDEELLGDAVAFSGVSRYVARVKCAMLAWVALEDALAKAA